MIKKYRHVCIDSDGKAITFENINDKMQALKKSVQSDFSDATKIEVNYICIDTSELSAGVWVTTPEPLSKYQKRVEKQKKEMAKKGLTEKTMPKILKKVEKGLKKLGV